MQQNEGRRFLRNLPWRWLVFLPTSLILVGWLILTPPGLLSKMDAIAYAVCHRIAARSFFVGSRQMPLCARCTGMYLGAVLGLGYQWVAGRKKGGLPAWPVLALSAFFVAAFGIDGVNSYLHLFPGAPGAYEPQNWLRLLTGSGMGISIAIVLFPAFNHTVWADVQAGPAISGWKQVLILLALVLGADLLVLGGNPLILYPVALLSSLGVLLILTMAYTMFWLMLFRKENLFHRLAQINLPLTAGFAVALLQIGVLDLVRYLLTGTWDGFHFG